jgi:uncharacterized protein (DUF1800 family)
MRPIRTQPATAPHVDYSENMVRHFIRDVAGDAEAERLQASFEVHKHLAAAYASLGQKDDSRQELTTYLRLRRETLWRESDR